MRERFKEYLEEKGMDRGGAYKQSTIDTYAIDAIKYFKNLYNISKDENVKIYELLDMIEDKIDDLYGEKLSCYRTALSKYSEFLKDYYGIKKSVKQSNYIKRTPTYTHNINTMKEKFKDYLEEIGMDRGGAYRQSTIDSYAIDVEFHIKNIYNRSTKEDVYKLLNEIEDVRDDLYGNNKLSDYRTALKKYSEFLRYYYKIVRTI